MTPDHDCLLGGNDNPVLVAWLTVLGMLLWPWFFVAIASAFAGASEKLMCAVSCVSDQDNLAEAKLPAPGVYRFYMYCTGCRLGSLFRLPVLQHHETTSFGANASSHGRRSGRGLIYDGRQIVAEISRLRPNWCRINRDIEKTIMDRKNRLPG